MERLRQYFDICQIRPPAQKTTPVYEMRSPQVRARRTGNYETLVVRSEKSGRVLGGTTISEAEEQRSLIGGGEEWNCLVFDYAD